MSSKLVFRIHESYRKVVAVCDAELVGKKFEEGIKQLEVRESFYKSQESDSEEIIEMMRRLTAEDATFNIVGKNSVNAAMKAGIIDEENIGKVQGVPFALVLI
jgi:hypothetical protein